MKLLHTSDWHLGRSLHRRKRYEEFEQFLAWITEVLRTEKPDALLIAGDIFDTIMPTNRAQELYYSFLIDAARSGCPNVVVIGGNHDSPTLLNAPRELLRSMNIHVVGSLPENPEDEVLLLHDRTGNPGCIVCAVPFLRDREIRKAEIGEGIDDRNRNLREGITAHYGSVAKIAEKKRAETDPDIPVIAMGHLFTQGGDVSDDEGVRDLYVGSLGHVPAGAFPEIFNYVALGHLHVPQRVTGCDHIRYSGSPIPMGFGEASQQKKVLSVSFDTGTPAVTEIEVPVFQQLVRIEGDIPQIESQIQVLAAGNSSAWLEVEYTGDDIIPALNETVETMCDASALELLLVKNRRAYDALLESAYSGVESLDQLDEYRVFDAFLAQQQIDDAQKTELKEVYAEALHEFYHTDTQAE